MKTMLVIAGIILLLAGTVWWAQGAGYFPYPAESFMINQARWIYIGLATAVVGAALIVAARWA